MEPELMAYLYGIVLGGMVFGSIGFSLGVWRGRRSVRWAIDIEAAEGHIVLNRVEVSKR